MRRPRRVPAALALAALLAGCRDDPAPFQPSDRRPVAPQGLFRLTLSPFDDAGPAWTPDGAEVVYAAGQTDLFPNASGALVAVPAGGGQARAVAQAYQESLVFPRLAAPALSPSGDRLAVAELRLTFPLLCAAGETLDCGEFAPPTIPGPELGLLVLSVRALDGAAAGPEHVLSFLDARRLDGIADTLETDAYQRFYSRGGLPFRPAWSPDGRRLAFSDGDSLYLWAPGEDDPRPVPGTGGAAAPAWSPDGATIAFVRLIGEEAEEFSCACVSQTDASVATRLVAEIAEHRLSLLDVASGEIADLGVDARDPAWSPDGGHLFVSRRGQVWRLEADDPASLEPIAGTAGGRHPAVSPDGAYLAFTVADALGLGDIWILPLGALP